MIFNRDCIHLFETYDIKLADSVLIKLEDAVRSKSELLVTIDASHYGFRNGNWVVYRHDTIRDDIPSFVMPPRPIIEKHSLKTSERFGTVIAADYKETKYYDMLSKNGLVDDLSTEEYMKMVKQDILPLQFRDRNFNGLGYVQVVGRIHNADGIKRILDKEFLTVSIGAIPRKLVCSECLQDQMDGLCEHYGSKSNKIFMLAESLEYEELSFVSKPADPFGRIVRIHDGIMDEVRIERETSVLGSSVDVMVMKDFFNTTEKTIVCVDNICTIINQEDSIMAKKDETKVTLSLSDEFGADKVATLVQGMSEVDGKLELTDELTDRQFALVQKTAEGLKRRFPLNDELNVRVGLTLIDEASDLTEAEKEKVIAGLHKTAKKLGVNLEDFVKAEVSADETAKDGEADTNLQDSTTEETGENSDSNTDGKTIESLLDELEAFVKTDSVKQGIEQKLEDASKADKSDAESPITRLFTVLKSLALDFRYAGAALEGSINSYLVERGQEAVKKGHKDEVEAEVSELKDQIKELEEDITLLDEQNRDLNYQLRVTLVDEIIASRDALGLIEDSVDAEREKFSKFNYDALVTQVNDYRKMKVILKDTTVNNNVAIKTIADPTLADSVENPNIDALQDGQLEDSEGKKELSFKEQVALVKACFRR